jgi:hypothetical protein
MKSSDENTAAVVLRVDDLHASQWSGALGEAGRAAAVLILDSSIEGPELEAHLEGVRAIREHVSDSTHVIYVSQNRQALRDLAEQEHLGVSPVYYHYFFEVMVRVVNNRFPDDASLRSYLVRKLASESEGPTRFSCLMNRGRPHRLVVLAWLLANGLDKKGFVSLNLGAYEIDGTPEELVGRATRAFPEFDAELRYLSRHAHTLPFRNFDEPSGADFPTSAFFEAYEEAPLALVVETEMTSGARRRFTEKSLKAIMNAQTAIVCGNPHTMGDLAAIGFDLQVPSYDVILDPKTRLRKVLESFHDFVDLAPTDFGDRLAQTRAQRYQSAMEFRYIGGAQVAQWVQTLQAEIALGLSRY